MRFLMLPLVAAALSALTGCRHVLHVHHVAHTPALAAYEAVDELIAQHNDRKDIGRMLVATCVDVNNVGMTSMFGRQMSEYIASRLTKKNIDVIHATVRQDHVQIREDGQFLLSRDIRNLAGDHNARTIIVGTYGVVQDYVLVSLKMVSTVDDSTIAATDFALCRTQVVNDMLSTYTKTW
jgi:TolB-like protein